MTQIHEIKKKRNVEVAIIGAGTAGLSARREVAKLTDDYIVIDGGDMGTTCARVGCMPSKVLIQVANDFARRQVLADEGIAGAEYLSVDTGEVMAYVRKLRDRFVRGVFNDMSQWQDKLLKHYTRFVDTHTLLVGDEKIHAKKIIIATGSTPIIPKNWRHLCQHIIDTDAFFELEQLPEKMIVIGLGVIGIELGQALAKLGVDVTLVGLGKSIGGLSDPEIQDYVAKQFNQQLTISLNGAELIGESDDGRLIVEIDGRVEHFDKALLALGRRPNLESLDLIAAGISIDNRGMPEYSETTYQLDDQAHIYLVGDVNAQRPLLHEAADQGRIAGFNAVRDHNQCFAKRTSLSITFCEPNIATVGKRYHQLREEEVGFITGRVSFEGQGRSIVKHKEQGLLHIYARKADGRILGAELQAPDGEHLAHLLAWAISNQMTVDETLAMPFYHPVVEEGVRTALRDASRQLDIKEHDMELFRCGDTPIR
ncbi:MAG: dihydrolipoyl dehydrogenase [Francisellaceae bacterium]